MSTTPNYEDIFEPPASGWACSSTSESTHSASNGWSTGTTDDFPIPFALSPFRASLQKGAGRTGHGARSERRRPMSTQKQHRHRPGHTASPHPLRRRARWGAILLALAVIGGGAWWL